VDVRGHVRPRVERNPDVSAGEEERPIGGWGMWLVMVTEDLAYEWAAKHRTTFRSAGAREKRVAEVEHGMLRKFTARGFGTGARTAGRQHGPAFTARMEKLAATPSRGWGSIFRIDLSRSGSMRWCSRCSSG